MDNKIHLLPPLIAEAYQAAANEILKALNPKIFFGYFSVCSDGKGHGNNTTFPGLDWGQSAETLLWIGRKDEVFASWEYVKKFHREDGLLPFAILPDLSGKEIMVENKYPMKIMPNGAVFRHWVPGNPLRTLANITFLILAEAIYAQTKDICWLSEQADVLEKATSWLKLQINEDGLMHGGGFYVERPSRLEFDGINQCYSYHAMLLAASLFAKIGKNKLVDENLRIANVLKKAFQKWFWKDNRCVEYIHPEKGQIQSHGFTDVDWAAIATGILEKEQIATIWRQIRRNNDFIYDGIPTGIATKPETYEDWEMQNIDRHDLAAMGRVWFLECWARWRMKDKEGIIKSIEMVAAKGKSNGWSWMERYYSEKTGDLARYHYNHYCEYPANLIRIVHRFLLNNCE